MIGKNSEKNNLTIALNVLYVKKEKNYNTIRLSRHEQVCLIRLRLERYFSHHWAMQMIMSRVFKGNMRTWTETIRLTDKKKLSNVTNIITQIKVIRP